MNAAQEIYLKDIKRVASDVCTYLEGKPGYETVAAYFFDLIDYVHKSRELVDTYQTIELDKVIKFPNLRNYQNDQS